MSLVIESQPMGRHHRRDEDVTLAVQQYEYLVRLLQQHKPAERSGLCLVCGIGWPCVEARLAAGARLGRE